MVREGKIPNINGFIKNGDMSLVSLPVEKKILPKTGYRSRPQRNNLTAKAKKQ